MRLRRPLPLLVLALLSWGVSLPAAETAGGAAQAAVAAAPAGRWTAATWDGKPAWIASCGGGVAIVAPAVGRLVSFAPPGGANLLFVPPGGAVSIGGATLRGGHQLWLGPQGTGPGDRWLWPPPASFEGAAEAVTVSDDGALLTLRLPTGSRLPDGTAAPTVTRTYRADPAGLACGVAWSDPRAWEVMMVFQVPRELRIAPLRLIPGPDAPLGFRVDAGKDDAAQLLREWGVDEGAEQKLAIATRRAACKTFLPPQPLAATTGGWRLHIAPLTSDGRETGPADHGLVTEVYMSNPDQRYVELEQCSNLLAAAEGKSGVEATVVLSLAPVQ